VAYSIAHSLSTNASRSTLSAPSGKSTVDHLRTTTAATLMLLEARRRARALLRLGWAAPGRVGAALVGKVALAVARDPLGLRRLEQIN
tara:strand:+ start:1429 stop:1692 length:264 start_codon:yes stop_codon:yes gene_type:complete